MKNILSIYHKLTQRRLDKKFLKENDQIIDRYIKNSDINELKEILSTDKNILNMLVHKAVFFQKNNVLEFLLEYRPDLSYSKKNGLTCLMKIAGAKLNYVEKYDEKSVMECAKLLLNAGANIKDIDNAGYNALFYAASANSPEIAELLHTKGVSLICYDSKGISVIELAIEKKSNEFIVGAIQLANFKELLFIKEQIKNLDNDKIKNLCETYILKYQLENNLLEKPIKMKTNKI